MPPNESATALADRVTAGDLGAVADALNQIDDDRPEHRERALSLLDALEGRLRAAVLDVFDVEPLPADSPLWSHDKVTVTPHIAGRSDPVTAAPIIAASIAELRSGSLPAATILR